MRIGTVAGFSGARWLQTSGVSLLGFVLLAVLCWLLAQWTWHFVAPKSAAVVAEPVRGESQAPLQTILSRHFFGAAGAVAASPAAHAQTSLNVLLRGVFAALGSRPAVAIVNLDGKDRVLQVGDELLPGVKLEAVFPDRVELSRQGALERLDLYPAAAAEASIAALPALHVRNTGPGRFAVSRAELMTVLSDPKLLAMSGQVSDKPGAGVLVARVQSGGVLEQLGFSQGDVIRRVNGREVGGAGDLGRLLQEFREAGEVSVEAARSGQTLNFNYTMTQ